MDKKFFADILRWHCDKKMALEQKRLDESEAFVMEILSSPLKSKEDIALSLSKLMGEDISSETLKWGVPSARFPYPKGFEVGSGYVYPIQNLGWMLVYPMGKRIMFLDKNMFEIEFCPPKKIISHMETIKRRTSINIITMIVLIIVIALIVMIAPK